MSRKPSIIQTIYRTPPAINEEDLNNKKYPPTIISLSDKEIIFDTYDRGSNQIILGTFAFVFLLGIGLHFSFRLDFVQIIIFLTITLPFGLLTRWFYKRTKNKKMHRIHLNRLSGEIIASGLKNNTSKRIILKDTQLRIETSHHYKMEGPNSKTSYVAANSSILQVPGYDPDDNLAFILWYMDKNRPLPPGTAFDKFRQVDFERRKAEGFPPPLHNSTVPTPEANPRHLAVREKYCGML